MARSQKIWWGTMAPTENLWVFHWRHSTQAENFVVVKSSGNGGSKFILHLYIWRGQCHDGELEGCTCTSEGHHLQLGAMVLWEIVLDSHIAT